MLFALQARLHRGRGALLESASRLDVIGGAAILVEALSAAGSRIDSSKLITCAQTLDLHAAYRRIGSIVDALERDGLAGKLPLLRPPTSDLDLEPSIHEPPVWRDKKWMVRWAQPTDELAGILQS